MSAIYEVLRQLDEWRHLPDYQLERRVDIFFGMFLPKVIKARFDVHVDEVIPEFPLHKGLLKETPDVKCKPHQSVKVDFAVFGYNGERKKIFLVELKTDMESLKKDQLENMKTVGFVGSEKLLEGVQSAALHSGSEHKYAHLVWKLLKLGSFCSKCSETTKKIKNIKWDSVNLRSVYGCLAVGAQWKKVPVKVVVIVPAQPNESQEKKVPPGVEVMTFAQIADILENPYEPFGSEATREFAGYLRQWACVKAGGVAPLYPYPCSCASATSD